MRILDGLAQWSSTNYATSTLGEGVDDFVAYGYAHFEGVFYETITCQQTHIFRT